MMTSLARVRRQAGVALLTVLIVVFLASLAATALASLQQFALRRSGLLLHQQQARLYALGAEEWAAALLERDGRGDSEIDHLDEDWATFAPSLPVEGGSVSGYIEDLQGRFNLNNLLLEEPQDGKYVDEEQLAALKLLLDRLGLDKGVAEAIADWIDPDQETWFPDGAEDGEYVGLEPPYLAANRPLVSVSELRLIKGIDEKDYARLAPYVSALPSGVWINVNTASAEVLSALSEEWDLESLQGLVEQRPELPPFTTPQDFYADAGLAGTAFTEKNLVVGSEYFLVHAQAQVGDARVVLHSLLQRSQQKTHILRRSFGNDGL